MRSCQVRTPLPFGSAAAAGRRRQGGVEGGGLHVRAVRRRRPGSRPRRAAGRPAPGPPGCARPRRCRRAARCGRAAGVRTGSGSGAARPATPAPPPSPPSGRRATPARRAPPRLPATPGNECGTVPSKPTSSTGCTSPARHASRRPAPGSGPRPRPPLARRRSAPARPRVRVPGAARPRSAACAPGAPRVRALWNPEITASDRISATTPSAMPHRRHRRQEARERIPPRARGSAGPGGPERGGGSRDHAVTGDGAGGTATLPSASRRRFSRRISLCSSSSDMVDRQASHQNLRARPCLPDGRNDSAFCHPTRSLGRRLRGSRP